MPNHGPDLGQKNNWKHVGVTFTLFGYERMGGRKSEFWKDPLSFSRYGGSRGTMLDADYDDWVRKHRIFTHEEVLRGKWIKISDLGSSREVQLHPDGTLTESEFVNPRETWEGTWEIKSGVLIMRVHDFILSIYASGESKIHSGIEIYEDEPYAYFKVIHLV